MIAVILLPGMDGARDLFAEFVLTLNTKGTRKVSDQHSFANQI